VIAYFEVNKMAQKPLHPSVQQFKDFVKVNPEMIREVRKGKYSWQELYEDWYLLGEEDSRWQEFKVQNQTEKSVPKKENSNSREWMSQIMNTVKKMDTNQLQEYISNLSQALGAIQGVISQFQGGNQANNQQQNQQTPPQHPFQFRKD
jgi:hypothetical protein